MSETLKAMGVRGTPDGTKVALTVQLSHGGAGIQFREGEPVADVCTKLRNLARELEVQAERCANGLYAWRSDEPPVYLPGFLEKD